MIKKSKKHLQEANENYFQHMGLAFRISFQLQTASIMAFFHALLPSIFTTSVSKKIIKLYSFLENRNRNRD